ncbi:MAG: M17 family peptidase N-terminal domain-containing protein [Myxococcota bacterium]|jgi:hypothetical protein|nr:M17 family peptidase N-terminal domain-containing protein [Myxococcota bacterium]
MQVSLAPVSLPSLDGLGCELLALGCFLEERPLRGAAGLVDWRLNGWLSRQLQQSRFRGEFAELLLFPVGHRIGPQRALLVGLGALADWDEARLGEAADLWWGVVARLRVKAVALAFPFAPRLSIPRRRLVPLLTAGVGRHLGEEEADPRRRFIVLAPAEEVKSLAAASGARES